MDHLEETDKFWKGKTFQGNQEEIENMNRPVTSTDIEIVIKNLPIIKSPGLDIFTAECYQTFREELVPTLLKVFQEISEERRITSSFYEATSTPTLKSDQ